MAVYDKTIIIVLQVLNFTHERKHKSPTESVKRQLCILPSQVIKLTIGSVCLFLCKITKKTLWIVMKPLGNVNNP